jgi:hypothetical protein
MSIYNQAVLNESGIITNVTVVSSIGPNMLGVGSHLGISDFYEESLADLDNLSLSEEITTPVLEITKRAFMKRFTLTERIAIRKSTDDVIIDVYEDLKLASYVELNTQDVSDALNYMVSVGILESSRVDEMLVEGEPYEAYP